MSKTEADNLKKIETKFLKKHKYLIDNNWKFGEITWTSGFLKNKRE